MGKKGRGRGRQRARARDRAKRPVGASAPVEGEPREEAAGEPRPEKSAETAAAPETTEARREKPAEKVDDKPRPRRRRTVGEPEGERNAALEWVKSIAIALVLFLFLRTFIVQTFVITSGSMEDTLLVGDMLVVNRVAIGTRIPGTSIRIPGYSTPERGDVLVFDPPHEEDMKLIKRLVGLPGDTLAMRNRVLYLNGEPLDEPYVVHSSIPDAPDPIMMWQKGYLVDTVDASTYRPTRDNWGPIVIPEDHYFMLGDNREQSYDSRYWGLLEGWRLEGRALFIYYSYNKGSYRPFPWIREVRWGRIFDGIH